MQQVVLVNEQDEAIGVMEKMEAHEKALLHRAFSVFLFDDAGRMLLQQRSMAKYHSAGLWTNTCCSHPYPGEEVKDAATRRLLEEMNIAAPISKAFHFMYKAPFDNGLTEHEFDHVFVGTYNGAVDFNADEVMAVRYVNLAELEEDMEANAANYTAWFKIAMPQLRNYLGKQNGLMEQQAYHGG